jgi:hypothetical protein
MRCLLDARALGRVALAALASWALSAAAFAQQRPLATEDPEPIGAGRILIEAGLDAAHNQEYPVSGLSGNLVRFPTLGLSFGISSIAELQFDGGLFDHLSIATRRPAPLSDLLTVSGNATHDFEDLVVGTKVRLKGESAHSPALALRFATRLPNATNESGLGLDTTDFVAALLGAKTVQSIRIVANLGLGILGDPTNGHQQNDAVMYGLSLARATTDHAELVGEINGRISTRSGQAPAGTESRGTLNLGGRYTRGSYRVDAAFFIGLTSVDPTVGFTTGFTYVFTAFEVP